MGSKNLKAIVVRGSHDLPVFDIQGLRKESQKAYGYMSGHKYFKMWQREGLMNVMEYANAQGFLPTHNFKNGQHANAGLIGSVAYRDLFDPGFDGCWKGCTVACAHGVKDFVPMTGPYQGKAVFVDGPEYETIAGCGSNLGIFDPFTILEMNFYCDAYGLDTISVGTSIAFAMECFEMGLINSDHTQGMDLSFGNRPNALALLHQMAKGSGFGVTVGQGVRRMKRIFAKDCGANAAIMQDIGMEAKGLE